MVEFKVRFSVQRNLGDMAIASDSESLNLGQFECAKAALSAMNCTASQRIKWSLKHTTWASLKFYAAVLHEPPAFTLPALFASLYVDGEPARSEFF